MLEGRRPLRLRYSWEARCRLVGMVLGGLSPQAASVACGMSRATAYRLCRRYQESGWEGLRDRPPVARHLPASALARGGGADRVVASSDGVGAALVVSRAGLAGVDDLASTRPAWLLACAKAAAPAGEPVRVCLGG
jgi:Helix-turn-helix domain